MSSFRCFIFLDKVDNDVEDWVKVLILKDIRICDIFNVFLNLWNFYLRILFL